MEPMVNADLPVFRAVYKLVLLVLLGVVWMLCCIPVFTIGPATAALYYTVAKVIRHDEGSLWAAFFGAFRSNFRRGSLVTVLALVYALVIGFSAYTAWALSDATGTGVFAPYIVGALVLPLLLMLPYLFPVLSRFDYSVRQLLTNCLYLSIRHFASTALFWVLAVGGVLAVLYAPYFLMAVPGVLCWLVSYPMETIFRRYMPKPEPESGVLPWYWR